MLTGMDWELDPLVDDGLPDEAPLEDDEDDDREPDEDDDDQ